jgi:hypothetical protein
MVRVHDRLLVVRVTWELGFSYFSLGRFLERLKDLDPVRMEFAPAILLLGIGFGESVARGKMF